MERITRFRASVLIFIISAVMVFFAGRLYYLQIIETDGKTITAVVTNNGRITADHYFSSMPVRDLVAGMGDVPPQDVQDVAAGLPYRDFITVGLLVDKMELQNQTKHKTCDYEQG